MRRGCVTGCTAASLLQPTGTEAVTSLALAAWLRRRVHGGLAAAALGPSRRLVAGAGGAGLPPPRRHAAGGPHGAAAVAPGGHGARHRRARALGGCVEARIRRAGGQAWCFPEAARAATAPEPSSAHAPPALPHGAACCHALRTLSPSACAGALVRALGGEFWEPLDQRALTPAHLRRACCAAGGAQVRGLAALSLAALAQSVARQLAAPALCPPLAKLAVR